MTKPLNILLLEDNLNDAELIRFQLTKSGFNFRLAHIIELDLFIETVRVSQPDLILSDYNLIGYTGLDALQIVKTECPLIPFIIVTGNLDEETSAETIKSGAWDYVLKDRLGRLELAIKNALELKKEKAEKAKALENLKKSEERFSLAVNGTMDGIWDQNIETGECYYSPRYKSMLGYNEQEFKDICNTWINLLHPDDKEATLLALLKNLNHELPQYKAEFRMKCKDGTYKWILSLGKAIFDNTGKACRITGSNKDISERKERERELIEAKEKAEESNRLKSAFLNNISHEIRTPMNAIQGYSDLFNKRALTEDKKNQFNEIINKSGKRLLHIVDDILDISKIESKQLEINTEIRKVKPLLDEIIDEHRQRELVDSKPNIEFRTAFPSNFMESTLVTDPVRFKQIWYNLISNSIKFTDKGFVEIGCQLKNSITEEIVFYVKDTGIGISDLEKDKIFEPFRQADNERFKEGTGLGLSITKGLVQLLNGKIWFESIVNIGTIFYFSFPLILIKKKDNQKISKEILY